LGGVFLSVTGTEALYADMGHFGAWPIRIGWYAVVFPGLILNYAGQGAHILAAGSATTNPFYELCPAFFVLPLTGLATLATIIASITGAFSMTRQAIRLGSMPRMRITQTSEEGHGQIYVSPVNWLLMIVTIALTLGFKKSTNLASAYGIAVSATMLMTTMLLFIATRKIWAWNLLTSSLVAGAFLVVDGSFFLANVTKIKEGGYVPLLLALAVYAVMYIRHRGISAITERVEERPIPIEKFMADLAAEGIARPSGTAIFLTRTLKHTPPVVAWYVDHAKALQQSVVAILPQTR
jgi:KUP system potassium uptake protein